MQLIEHNYSNKPPRFYVDGIRVPKYKIEYIKDTHRLDCMSTKCKFDDKGNCHRVNYTTATKES